MPSGYLVSVLLTIVSRVSAQDSTPFPDTKANHWVYVALGRNGYNGPPMTRGEVVDAIVEAYGRLSQPGISPAREVTDLNAKIKQLNTASAPSSFELDKDFRAVASVLTLISANEGTHEEIVDVELLSDAFSKELAARGMNSKEIEKSLSKADKGLFLDAKAAKELGDFDRPFPDTKKNHWAYEAVTRLKTDGLISGYDDGMFIGNRLWTRVEFAERIHTGYSRLFSLTEELSSEIDSVNEAVTKLQESGLFDEAAKQRLKARLQDIRDQIDWMRGNNSDIADLKRLLSVFGPEMSVLGLDVEDILHTLNSYKKPVYELSKRAAKVEKAIQQSFSGGPVVTPANGTPPLDQNYPHSKKNDWVFEAMWRLKTEGLLLGLPGTRETITSSPYSRRDVALNFLAAYTKLLNLLDRVKTDSPRITVALHDDEPMSYDEALESFKGDIEDLKRPIVEFASDLSALGHDPRNMMRTLDRLKPSGKHAPIVAGR